MTHPLRGRPRAATSETVSATELSIPIGPAAVDVLDLAYRARRAVLLEGPTGIGKSQIVADFARQSGLDVIVLDLSLLEPPDLVGLPVIEGGRTRYASPAELPASGRGILMLEELNRAELPVMQPALQLLSARRLHGYELPPDWSCVAAINPEDGDYQVNRLDPALRSRFLQVGVRAERDTWLDWAGRANVHPVIARVVRDHEGAFEHASPRSFTYASDLLHALRDDELGRGDLVRVALRGYLPTSWAILVTEALAGHAGTPPIEIERFFAADGVATLARAVAELGAGRRIDAIAMLSAKLRRFLASGTFVEAGFTLERIEQLLAPLPGDLREQCLDSAVQSPAAAALLRAIGHEPSHVAGSYAGSPLRDLVLRWRREMALHRVRLVVVAVAQWLDRDAPTDPATMGRVVAQLGQLVIDAGPLGADLARRLRARGLLEGAPRL